MMRIQDFIARQGVTFTVDRNGTTTFEAEGLMNHEKATGRAYIGFIPEADIKAGDWLINELGEKFYILDTQSDFFQRHPFQLKAYYCTETEFKQKNTPNQSTIFNIENIYGSFVGNSSNATLNYQVSIADMREKIETEASPDKEDLAKIVSLLEMIVSGNIPVSKGLFSRFSSVMERNSWITGAIASALLNWLSAH